jgi:hypothetical protein
MEEHEKTPLPIKPSLRKPLSLIFLFPFLFLIFSSLSPPSSIEEIPKSNRTASSYPFLSYKIFFAVLLPWLEPIPQPQPTLLRIPDRSAQDLSNKTAAV